MKCLSKSASGNALLLDHAAGRLKGGQAAKTAAHLRGCQVCQETVNGQAQVWMLLDNWQPEPVSRSFNRQLYARIAQEPPPTIWGFLLNFLNGSVTRPALPLAAFSLLVIAGFYLERPHVSTVTNPAAVEAPTSVSPGDAEQLDKALDDLHLLHQLDLVKDEAPDASKAM